MFGYTMYGTNDLPKAVAFYDAVFAAMGAKQLMTFPNGAVAWGTAFDKPMFSVGPPHDGKAATVGNGAMMALVLDERAKVDAVYDAAIAAGGTSEGAPGVRGSEGPQAFYAGYFRDLDGNKMSAFRVGPA